MQLETTLNKFWRFVRKQFIADLLEKRWDPKQSEMTGLFRILANRFPKWVTDAKKSSGVLKIFERRADESLHDHLAEFSQYCEFPSTLRTVLPLLWHEKHKLAARDWLFGEPQTEETLKALGVPVTHDTSTEEESKSVVLSLCRLANEDCPLGNPTSLIVCFDQIEGMTDNLEEPDALQTIAKAVNSLLIGTGPRVVATFLRDDFYHKHNEKIDRAYRDRLMQSQGSFPRLHFEQAVQVIAHRIQANSNWRAEKTLANGDSFWPFGEKAIRGLVEENQEKLTPRFVLLQCAVWVQDMQKGKEIKIPKRTVEVIISNTIDAQSQLDATGGGLLDSTKPDENAVLADDITRAWTKQRDKYLKTPAAVKFDNAVGIGLPWLRDLLGVPLVKANEIPKHLKYLDLLFTDPTSQRLPIGVSACSQTAQALTHKLRRVATEWEVAKQSQFLSTLAVLRPKAGSIGRAGQEKLDALAKTGAQVKVLASDVVAEFAAYQEMFTATMKGDVTRAGKPIDASEYNEWAKAHLTPAVRKLAEDVFGLTSQITK